MGKIYNLVAPPTGEIIQSMDDVRAVCAEYDRLHPPENCYDRSMREKREATERERKAQKAHEQQTTSTNENWNQWARECVHHYVMTELFGPDGPLTLAIGETLGHKCADLRKEFRAENTKVRDELASVEHSLHTEIRSQLDRVTDTHLNFYRDFYAKVETLGQRF